MAAIVLASLIPSLSLAAGGENIRLSFSQTDYYFLGASLVFGIIAVGLAFFMMGQVTKQSPGPESMQKVGAAIVDGAMAYLRQQIRTMGIFVVLLALLLFGMYYSTYGPVLAAATALCFVAGVGASYMAGFVGMKMAVQANMRTAFAALTSYAKALQIAFRSGAVAGLITVGMGLIGATLILGIFAADAMKLLVGFGFGGSLAALFMRVGGGIYTKAADVGADLVGKVEAGIPEDDPRNPAVIADNVGDNVGDCAGMAADVFESYEVTLVAAIILGAATAALFDTATWTKLVMFALMARGAGIIASIVGIYSVSAKDGGEMDPLKPISKGFNISLITAIGLTTVLAFFMMGGTGAPIRSGILQTSEERIQGPLLEAQKARQILAAQLNIPKAFLSPVRVADEPGFAAAVPDRNQRLEAAYSLFGGTSSTDVKKLEGYQVVDFKDSKNPVLNLAVTPARPNPASPATGADVVTFKERFEESQMTAWQVEIKDGTGRANKLMVGPAPKQEGADIIKQESDRQKTQGGSLEIIKEFPVAFYANANNDVVMAVKDSTGQASITGMVPISAPATIYKVSVADYRKQNEARTKAEQDLATKRNELETKRAAAIKARDDAQKANNTAQVTAKNEELSKLNEESDKLVAAITTPSPAQISNAIVVEKTVEWWRFLLCVVFGIVMAFAFERLTDYYVSMHGKPVQEVTQVATAGPAPMIISGFAYGKESSVFSVFAIVGCLIGPLLIFPPGEFGGYLLSFYGIALVGLGLLTTTGYILAMDTFGPISDNAQGVYEMSGEGHDNPEAARSVQLLDAAGNTTKALTKGFAIATAVVAAVALFHAFVEAGKLTVVGMRIEIPEIFLGLLIGGAVPYLFSAFAIQAVGRAAFELIMEVRRQFRAKPGIMKGTEDPDYGTCVAIVTAAAQRELLGPGLLAIGFPVFVAFVFSIGKDPTLINGSPYNLVGAQALGGFLAGTILSGQLMAVLLANAGGMWDNAKKLVEDGMHGGKGTEAHKAAVVCDTVGDPFKDTAGPALNPLIKVMNLVALLVAPLVIQPLPQFVYWIVSGISLAAIIFAIYTSKKGSMSSQMKSMETEVNVLIG